MKRNLGRRIYTSKLIEGQDSGYGELRLYPQHTDTGYRRKRYRKTLLSQQRANDKRSQHSCYLEAVENFKYHDYFLTYSFSPDMPDDERLKLQKKAIRYLQGKCKKAGSVMKYIYNWGRGKEDNKLHSHMLANQEIPYESIRSCSHNN